MTESEGQKPERRFYREGDPIDLRLKSSEIGVLLDGLILTKQEQTARLNRTPNPGEDPEYTKMDRVQAQKEIDDADALFKKLVAILDSQDEGRPEPHKSDNEV